MSGIRRRLLYAKPKELPNYLCFTALESGTFTLTIDSTLATSTLQYIEYSIDGKSWVRTDNVNSEQVVITTPTISENGKVYWRGYGSSLNNRNKISNTVITSTCRFDASGEVLSLLRGKNFENDRNVQAFNMFAGLFKGCDTLINTEDMIINTTNRFPYAYQEMFMNCTNLLTTPNFINVNSESPFNSTFKGCTALKYITHPLPLIPTVNYRVFSDMFSGCTSLIEAPELPYTELPSGAFSGMFNGCTSLVEVPDVLPATTLGSACYRNMFNMCTSLTKAPQIAAKDFPSNACYNMFAKCTNLTDVPTINIQSFAGTENLFGMFDGCTSLVHSPLNITSESIPSRCMIYCFRNCTSLSDVYLPSTTLTTLSYHQAFRGSSVSYVKMYATTIASNSLADWMYGVPNVSTSIFVKHIDATWTDAGTSGIPTNWTVIYYDPALDKYYLDQQRNQECDDHGNPI